MIRMCTNTEEVLLQYNGCSYFAANYIYTWAGLPLYLKFRHILAKSCMHVYGYTPIYAHHIEAFPSIYSVELYSKYASHQVNVYLGLIGHELPLSQILVIDWKKNWEHSFLCHLHDSRHAAINNACSPALLQLIEGLIGSWRHQSMVIFLSILNTPNILYLLHGCRLFFYNNFKMQFLGCFFFFF